MKSGSRSLTSFKRTDTYMMGFRSNASSILNGKRYLELPMILTSYVQMEDVTNRGMFFFIYFTQR